VKRGFTTFMKTERGFTLVEIMVVMSVVMVAGGLLLAILVNSTGVFYQQSAKLNQGLGVNDSLSSIRKSIKEADSIAANYPLTGTPQYSSGPSQMVLRLPAIDVAGSKIYNVFDYIVYAVFDGRLYFKLFPDTQNGSVRIEENRILTGNVSSVRFEYLDVSNNPVALNLVEKVKVTLVLEQKAGNGYEKNTATSEANLRND